MFTVPARLAGLFAEILYTIAIAMKEEKTQSDEPFELVYDGNLLKVSCKMHLFQFSIIYDTFPSSSIEH